uniref:Putative similar to chymotrypsin-elastase inhibitor ixodidin n=1 Tax=Rhipicephalus pulchellus TaxID=72859 RepID=L7MAI5_RHIPC
MRILIPVLLGIISLEAVFSYHNPPCHPNEVLKEAASSNCGEDRCNRKARRCKRDSRSGCFCGSGYYREGGPSGPCVSKRMCKRKMSQ